MSEWLVDTNVFEHPFNCIMSAPTMGGKTNMIKELLKYKNVLIDPIPNNIIFCYKAWQPSYDIIKAEVDGIQFIEGILDIELISIQKNNLVIFDDLMKECINNEEVKKIEEKEEEKRLSQQEKMGISKLFPNANRNNIIMNELDVNNKGKEGFEEGNSFQMILEELNKK